MEALLHRLLARAEHAGGEEWIQQCLSLPLEPQPASGSIMDLEHTVGPSGADTFQTCLSAEVECPSVAVPGVMRSDDVSEEDGTGRRTSKQRRSQRRSVSPAPPRATDGSLDGSFCFAGASRQAQQRPRWVVDGEAGVR